MQSTLMSHSQTKPIIPIFYIHWRIVQVSLTTFLTDRQHISLEFGSMWDLLFPYSVFQMWNLHHSVYRIIKESYTPIYTCVYIYIYISYAVQMYIYCIWLAGGCTETLLPSGCSWHGAKLFMGCSRIFPDSQVHGVNMGPIWGREDPGGAHVDPMNLAIWVATYYYVAVLFLDF